MKKRKIVVAVTGASGSVYAARLLNKLKQASGALEEIALIYSNNARDIWQQELGEVPLVSDGLLQVYEKNNFYAPFASGSGVYDAMIIVPCSMGTLGRIAGGISDDLITRAADVFLKERKQLIVVPRENPLNLIHLRNMVTLTEAGATICASSPSFYSMPDTLEAVVDTVVNRLLDQLDIEHDGFRWGQQ